MTATGFGSPASQSPSSSRGRPKTLQAMPRSASRAQNARSRMRDQPRFWSSGTNAYEANTPSVRK